ncbi:hypothetical protein, partial [Salmonella enterica]|uniref:hypothetical protein n=1 Tax=Salmonella enterica TaxID=28901 RepID=UPI003CEC7C6E
LLGIEEEDGSARLLPGGEVRLRDASGALVAGVGPGLIEIAGAQLFTGYWRRADATRAVFENDGYFSTGLEGRRLP